MGSGAGVSDFFTMYPNLKKKSWEGVMKGGGGRLGVSDFFLQRIQI